MPRSQWRGRGAWPEQKETELTHEEPKVRFGCVAAGKQAQNPEAEREAWQAHFKAIQQDREIANDKVWDNIPITPDNQRAAWMDRPPTDGELDRCVGSMKIRKAPGEDRVMAEVLKYGSAKFRAAVYNVVRKMWTKAAEAPVEARKH